MRASRTTAGMKTRNIRHKHPRRGVLPGGSARQRRQKRSSQQENNEPRRRYSCDCTGIAPPFLSFLRRFYRSGTGNPTRALLKIAYRGAQKGPVRACGARAEVIRATAEGRRMGAQQPVCGAAWAWPLAAIGGANRGSTAQAHTITDAMQTNAINKGSGQRGYWGSSQFFYFTLHFYQKDCARDRQKNRSGREQLTPSPPYLRFRSWGLRTPAGGQALIARGQNFQGGLPHDLTLYFLHNS